MKKYLVRKTTKYARILAPEELTLVKTTPKGWKLTTPRGNTFFYLSANYCLFDTLQEANAYARNIALENISELEARIEGWKAAIKKLGYDR